MTLFMAIASEAQTAEQLKSVELSLRTGNPISVVEKGRESEFYFQAENPRGKASVSFRIHLAMTDEAGRTHEWTSQPVTVSPNQAVQIPLGEAIPSLGWWRLQPTLRAVGSDMEAVLPTREVAVIHTVGSRKLPPHDEFWFGLDSRVRTPAMLRLFSRMGVDILRFGTWSAVNPDEGKWDWQKFDQTVDAIRAENMQALYSVTFSPAWAIKPEHRGKGDPSRKPPRSEAVREALKTIIAHTKSKGIAVYDLWNEPDHRGFWHGTPDEYLEFLQVASETIKSVQPDATVLSGGIASLHTSRFDGPHPQMDRRIIVEGRKWYDAIALHEHGSFDRFAAALDGPLKKHQAELAKPAPLWFTETGFDGNAIEKANVLVQKLTYARAQGAKGFICYALYSPGQGGGYNIINKDGDPQPIIPAYCHMVRMMRDKKFARSFEDSTQSGNELFAFTGKGNTLLVAWGLGATAYRVPVQVTDGASVSAFDIMGRSVKVERFNDTVYLPFSRTPQYLLINGEMEVAPYEKISPLALFEFGDLNPIAGKTDVMVSPLKTIGWDRNKVDDQDKRMAQSTSGLPNGSFDGERETMGLEFTITPKTGTAIDIESLNFWANSGAFDGTTVTMSIQIGEAEPKSAGVRKLRNLSAPRTKGEFYNFPLSDLEGVTAPITFTLKASRNGQRVILKIDDLRVDGFVRVGRTPSR